MYSNEVADGACEGGGNGGNFLIVNSAAAGEAALNDEKFDGCEKDSEVSFPTLNSQSGGAGGVQDNTIGWNLDILDEVLDESYVTTGIGIGTTGEDTTVYVVDTGGVPGLTEFQGGANIDYRYCQGFDASRPSMGQCNGTLADRCSWNGTDTCALDEDGHGTFAAALIGGQTVGVAPGVVMHAVRAVSGQYSGFLSDVIRSLDWVLARSNAPWITGGKVMYMGLSRSGLTSPSLRTAVEDIIASGMSAIVPAGDAGADACTVQPGNAQTAITVASMNTNYGLDSNSNYGACVDIVAPGVSVYSIGLTGNSETHSGTSFAAAHVAGLASLVTSWAVGSGSTTYTAPSGVWAFLRCAGDARVISNRRNTPQLVASSLLVENVATGGASTATCVDSVTVTTTDAPTPAPTTTGVSTTIDYGGQDTPSPGPSPVCFPGDSTVQVRGRGAVQLRDLHAGDQVQGKLSHEPVLGFLHALTGHGEFVKVTHSLGEFRASADHIVFVSGPEGRVDKLASQLKVGDLLLSGDAATSEVLAISSTTTPSGVYAPLTPSGTVFIDGVLASNYASLSGLSLPHSSVHAWLAPVRLYHRMGLNAFLGRWWTQTEKVPEMHPFVDLFFRQLRVDKLHRTLASF